MLSILQARSIVVQIIGKFYLPDNSPCFPRDKTRTLGCDWGGKKNPDWGRRTKTCS